MKKSAYRRIQQTMRVKKKRTHDTASSMIPWFESSLGLSLARKTLVAVTYSFLLRVGKEENEGLQDERKSSDGPFIPKGTEPHNSRTLGYGDTMQVHCVITSINATRVGTQFHSAN